MTTVLYVTEFLWGSIRASDDLDEVAWIDLKTINRDGDARIMEEHWPLMASVLGFYDTQKAKKVAHKETK